VAIIADRVVKPFQLQTTLQKLCIHVKRLFHIFYSFGQHSLHESKKSSLRKLMMLHMCDISNQSYLLSCR